MENPAGTKSTDYIETTDDTQWTQEVIDFDDDPTEYDMRAIVPEIVPNITPSNDNVYRCNPVGRGN